MITVFELNKEYNAAALGISIHLFNKLQPFPLKHEIDELLTLEKQCRDMRAKLINDRISK
jgi:hypothetical protein